MKKKTNIRTMIRQIVREEVAMAIKEVITELKKPSLSSPQVSKPKQRKISIGSTDKDVLDRFVSVVGYGYIGNAKFGSNSIKPFYEWQLEKRIEVLRILKMFLPHLGKRRSEKAIEAINHLNETIN